MARKTLHYLRAPPINSGSLLHPWAPSITPFEFDPVTVAGAAMGEIISSPSAPLPLSNLFDEMLVSGEKWLRWRDNGFGVGREMRRGLSAIFGRFFARAYLESRHGLTHFWPLDGSKTVIGPGLIVERDGDEGDMPDWICMGARKIMFAEAKGSLTEFPVQSVKLPGPIKSAIGQLQRAAICAGGGSGYGLPGIAVLSSWSRQSRPKYSPRTYEYKINPSLSSCPKHILDQIARSLPLLSHSAALRWLGHNDAAREVGQFARSLDAPVDTAEVRLREISDQAPLYEVEAGPLYGRKFTGRFIVGVGMGTVIPGSQAELADLHRLLSRLSRRTGLPAPPIYFVGLDVEVLSETVHGRLRTGFDVRAKFEQIRSAPRGERLQRIYYGFDGLVMAPFDSVRPIQ